MNWNIFIKIETKQKYFKNLKTFLKYEFINKEIYPSIKDIFKPFNLTPFKKIKIVFIGQDPYYLPGLADGLAFSVNQKNYIPKSLKNIFIEIKKSYPNFKYKNNGKLDHWAKNGILLINSILTVEKNKPLSHSNRGWEIFIQHTIEIIDKYKNNIIFIFFGNKANNFKKFIKNKNNIKITLPHPVTNKFKLKLKNKYLFKKINILLLKKKISPINWY